MPSLAHASKLFGSNDFGYTWLTPQAYCEFRASSDSEWLYSRYTGNENDYSPGGTCYIIHTPSGGEYSVGDWSYRDLVCPDGYIDNGSGLCIEDIQCNAGDYQDISFMSHSELDPASISTQQTGTSTITVDGCEATINKNDFSNCSRLLNGEVWCTTRATNTGNQGTEADNVSPSLVDSTPEPTPPENCGYSLEGNLICQKEQDPNCGTYNGVETCVNDEPNCGTVNGTDVCFDDSKNCGYVNGKAVCVQPPPEDSNTYGAQNSAPDGCFKNEAGNKVCVNDVVKETETTTTSTAPDGTVTQVINTTFNIQGSGSKTTTTTTSPDGTVTKETETKGDDKESQEDKYTVSEGSGSFNTANSQILTDIETAKADLMTQFNEIKGEVLAIFDLSVSSSAAGLPCFEDIVAGEFVVPMCFSNMETSLSPLVIILSFLFVLISVFIILK